MWIGDQATNSYPVLAKGTALKINEGRDVIHAEEYAMIFLKGRHVDPHPGLTAEEDSRNPKYDREVSSAAIAKGRQIYKKSVFNWIDKLKASEMQGSYYFEALKVLLSSQYREWELKICSVEDRRGQRLSVRKPHFTGAVGDIMRLTKVAVAHKCDLAKPTIIEYNDDVNDLIRDQNSTQEKTPFEKKARNQERNPKLAKSNRSKHGLFCIFDRKKKEKAQNGADKGSAETKEQYVDKLLRNLEMVNELSQQARDTLNAAEAEDVNSEVDQYRVAVIESTMTAKVAKIMEEFHECEENPPGDIDETVEELNNLTVSPEQHGGATRV